MKHLSTVISPTRHRTLIPRLNPHPYLVTLKPLSLSIFEPKQSRYEIIPPILRRKFTQSHCQQASLTEPREHTYPQLPHQSKSPQSSGSFQLPLPEHKSPKWRELPAPVARAQVSKVPGASCSRAKYREHPAPALPTSKHLPPRLHAEPGLGNQSGASAPHSKPAAPKYRELPAPTGAQESAPSPKSPIS